MPTIKERCKRLLRPVYHNGLVLLITLIRRARGDWEGLTLIDPSLVKLTVNRRDPTLKWNTMWHFGTVCGGDWDVDGALVQEYGYIYPILKQRVEGGLAYDEIPEFRQNLELVRQGKTPENCRSESQYREKWTKTEKLYWTIKSEGYQTQRQLKAVRPLNEIRIQVGRNGDLLFEEGIHRLVIAQLLGLKRVPTIVTRQHVDWVAKNGRWRG